MEKVSWWKSKRAHRAGWIALGVILVGLVVWRFFFYPYVRTDDARVAMTLVHLAPSGIGGRIIKVNVNDGSTVKAGEVLIEIEHRVAQAEFERARAKHDEAAKELDRMERLFRAESVSAQTLDSARAKELAANADLKLAEVNLENTYLRSPFDGVVVKKMADESNLLQPNQTALVIADTQDAWIEANIEETSIAEVKLGQPVKITIDEGGVIEGKVSEINRAAASQFALIPSDNGAGNYTKVVQRIPIKISIDDHDRVLRAGQSVEIRIRVH